MQPYPKRIQDQIRTIKHGGKLADATASGGSANFECGSAVKVWLKIDENVVVNVKFQTSGCGYASAAADVLAKYLTDKPLTNLAGFGGGSILEFCKKIWANFRPTEYPALKWSPKLFERHSQIIDRG